MYKMLLCWRYLRTRWIALASIVSVTLGVATLIVVNSVMAGFATQMQERLQGILSDVKVQALATQGMPDPELQMRIIEQLVGDKVAAMTPTVEAPGMLSFRFLGQWQTRQVAVIGIDPEGRMRVGDFAEHLVDSRNRKQPSFELYPEALAYRREKYSRPFGNDGGPQDGLTPPLFQDDGSGQLSYPRGAPPAPGGASGDSAQANMPITLPPSGQSSPVSSVHGQEGEAGPPRSTIIRVTGADPAGQDETPPRSPKAAAEPSLFPDEPGNLFPQDAASGELVPADPFDFGDKPFGSESDAGGSSYDPTAPQPMRVIPGYLLGTYRHQGVDGTAQDVYMIRPGDDVQLAVPTAGPRTQPAYDNATVVDFFRSNMSEYDSNFVFVPIEQLQWLRGMIDEATGTRYVSSIQIKLKDYADADEVVAKLRQTFKPGMFYVSTWEEQQGPLLAAVSVESGILNVLLFLIIAVAGFGILAIFFMIVVEKTRDIGILKALGASSRGVMGIFLSYGLSLGVVGSGLGMVLGLLFVHYINEIELLVSKITGHKVFDEQIYYFSEIPTQVNPFTVTWIVVGALLIAVAASILPARRAAKLHPVEALRYDQ